MCSVWGKVLGQTPFNAVIAVDGFTRGVVVPDIQSFRYRICLTDEGVRSEGERIENLNLKNRDILGVSKFHCLGDMLNGEGGSSLASISRVRCGWKKFRAYV